MLYTGQAFLRKERGTVRQKRPQDAPRGVKRRAVDFDRFLSNVVEFVLISVDFGRFCSTVVV